MLRDITLGQYYPGYSVIHKIDTRIKIVLTFLYMVSIFIVGDFIGYAIILACLAVVIRVSQVPARFILRGLKPVFIIIAFTFILNILVTDGKIIFQFHFIKITEEGIYNAVFMACRIMFLILGSSLLTFTTKPVKMTDGIESLLRPLNRFKVPVHELAMMMTIALRFIPTLLEETDKIMKAQMARGADFETGNLIRRAKNLVPLFIPLIIGAFRMAADLAMAMEARCYRGGEGRTKLHSFKIGKRDIIAIVVFAVYIAALWLERIYHVQILLLDTLFR